MDFLSQKKDLLLTYTAVFLLFFIRFVYYGFEYYPQLDDYIQYYSYRQFLGTVPEIIEKLGLFSVADLLTFFPRDYSDRRAFKKAADLADGESACVRAG